jgi:putative FmdB family regulatory protein
MPIYEFRCESCSQIFEHLAISSNDKFEAKCPHCGGEEIARVMSVSNCAMGDSVSGSAGAPGGVENRSCGSDSCTTITLPGHTR